MKPESSDFYFITPSATDRKVFYAPQTNVVFFWGIDEDKFAELAPEFFTAIAKSDSCVGYIWGELRPPHLADPSGNGALGVGGVMISGWTSKEEHARDVAKQRVVDAYAKVSEAVQKTDTWGMSVSIAENNGMFHKWRKLTTVQKPLTLSSPGRH
jgi:hypothetical protein